MNRFRKAIFLLRNEGLIPFLRRVICYPREIYRNYNLRLTLENSRTPEIYFTRVYFDSKKRKLESVSGIGSSFSQTANLRNELPVILKKYNIRSIVDAPCGDTHWIKKIITNFDGVYTGFDIVEPLISALKEEFNGSSNRITFKQENLLSAQLPEADLVICRDFLFHLSVSDSLIFLTNLKTSRFKYFLTTSHETPANFLNHDIRTGGFRTINLFLPPYKFSQKFLIKIRDYAPPEYPKYLILWDKESLFNN